MGLHVLLPSSGRVLRLWSVRQSGFQGQGLEYIPFHSDVCRVSFPLQSRSGDVDCGMVGLGSVLMVTEPASVCELDRSHLVA